jgi:predicted restriction endonuclease
MKIHRYNPNKQRKETVFYIQSHGLHAGRPLKEPIPNSWELDTEIKNAFEICFMVYNSKILSNYLRGSVIPFLSLHEYKKIMNPIFNNPVQHQEPTLKKLNSLLLLDKAIQEQEAKHRLYKQLKTAIAHELIKTFY